MDFNYCMLSIMFQSFNFSRIKLVFHPLLSPVSEDCSDKQLFFFFFYRMSLSFASEAKFGSVLLLLAKDGHWPVIFIPTHFISIQREVFVLPTKKKKQALISGTL